MPQADPPVVVQGCLFKQNGLEQALLNGKAAMKHTQQAVDRYLKDFHPARTCYRQRPAPGFVSQVTGMAKHLVKQHVDIIEHHANCLLTGNVA